MSISCSGDNARGVSIELVNQSLGEDDRAQPGSQTLFDQALKLLQSGNLEAALAKTKQGNDARLLNLRAVVLMRLNRGADALNILRPMAIASGTLDLKPNLPLCIKVNLATALFMCGHVGGCLDVLAKLQNESNPQIDLLRRNIRSWEKKLSYLKWLDWKYCGIDHGAAPASLDYVPGEVGLPKSWQHY